MPKKEHHFRGQRPGEKIIIFARRHWVRNVLFILSLVGLDLIYFIVVWALLRYSPLEFVGATKYVLTTLSGIVVLTSWLLFYIRWIDFYLDIWILTNDRIVQIKQNSLFDRQIAGFDLSTIQDVVAKQRGPLATFLNYGTIFVQTAATTELFMFNFIPHPFKVKEAVLSAQEKLENRAKAELGQMVAREGEKSPTRHDATGGGKPESPAGPPTKEVPPVIDQDEKKVLKRGFKGLK